MIFLTEFWITRRQRLRDSLFPSLLTRTTNDITQVQMLITMGLQVVTRGPIMAIWAIGKILGHSEYWLWAVLVAVIVNVLMTTVLMTLAFPKQSLIQGLTDKLNSITRESLTGIRVFAPTMLKNTKMKNLQQQMMN